MFVTRRAASVSLFLSLASIAHRTGSSRSFATMSQREWPPSVVEPREKHSASVIMMHGLGDTADGWIDVAESLAMQLPHVRFILPTASEKAVTLNNGMMMPSWYDIRGLSSRSKETCEGLEGSTSIVRDLIQKEVEAGVSHARIVVSGFSQGGAMSLWVGLQHEQRLAGVISMSGYLPRPESFKPSTAALDTPVLFCHGTSDDVVRLDWAQLSEKRVKETGVKNVQFKIYERMGHSAVPTEIRDVLKFLAEVIPPN